MKWYDAIGWAGIIIDLTCYTQGGHVFDVANLFTAPMIALPAYKRGAWPNVAISACFGLIALGRLLWA